MRALLLLLLAVDGVACMAAAPVNVNDAFTNWHRQMKPALEVQRVVEREVSRIVHPDVPVHLVFKGRAARAVLPGSATTGALRAEAARVLGLGGELKFILNGPSDDSTWGEWPAQNRLRSGIPISESPLANTRDREILVLAAKEDEESWTWSNGLPAWTSTAGR